jgi:serine/threonine protein kinase
LLIFTRQFRHFRVQPDGHLCLTDFGLAKQLGDDAAGSNSFCGTVDYMAPEIVSRTAEYGKAADWCGDGLLLRPIIQRTYRHGYYHILSASFVCLHARALVPSRYALGILIFEMLTGNTPFKGPNRKKVQENIISKPLKLPGNMSFDAQQIIKKLLQRTPHKRLGFGGAHEVMKSDFFASVDWAALACRQVPAPFIPQMVLRFPLRAPSTHQGRPH